MNKKKGIKNIVFSFLGQIIILFFGFLVPRIFLESYGSDTNGLTNTITQVFTYLALLEAGIAQATTNSLYKYINDKDKYENEISKIMSISQLYFRNVSKIYGIIVLLVSLLLPLLLKSNLSYQTMFLYILIEGVISVISFYFIQSWNALLLADGKNYIIISVDLLTKVLCFAVKIILALKGFNIIFIQVGCLFVSFIKLIVYRYFIIIKYKWIKNVKVTKNDKLENKSAYLISEIAWTIFSSTDMIVLSIFLSTQYASIYSIYNMAFLAINSLLNSVYNSLKYILCNAYFNDRKNYEVLHDSFNSIFFGAMTMFMCISYIMVIPFVKIYTNGINDVNYIYGVFPLLFCLVQLLSWSRYVSGNLTAIAGYAKNTSYVSIIEAIINLSLSVVLVKYLGIVGVLLATVFALPFKVIYCNYLSDKIILKRSSWNTIKILGINWLIFIVTVIFDYYFKIDINSIMALIIWGFLLSMIYLTTIVLLNYLSNSSLRIYIKKFLMLIWKEMNKYDKK